MNKDTEVASRGVYGKLQRAVYDQASGNVLQSHGVNLSECFLGQR